MNSPGCCSTICDSHFSTKLVVGRPIVSQRSRRTYRSFSSRSSAASIRHGLPNDDGRVADSTQRPDQLSRAHRRPSSILIPVIDHTIGHSHCFDPHPDVRIFPLPPTNRTTAPSQHEPRRRRRPYRAQKALGILASSRKHLHRTRRVLNCVPARSSRRSLHACNSRPETGPPKERHGKQRRLLRDRHWRGGPRRRAKSARPQQPPGSCENASLPNLSRIIPLLTSRTDPYSSSRATGPTSSWSPSKLAQPSSTPLKTAASSLNPTPKTPTALVPAP